MGSQLSQASSEVWAVSEECRSRLEIVKAKSVLKKKYAHVLPPQAQVMRKYCNVYS